MTSVVEPQAETNYWYEPNPEQERDGPSWSESIERRDDAD